MQKGQVEDAKFLREVSARCRKSGLRMQNFCGEYPQVIEKARCRCNLYMTGRLKSICKFEEKQVADTLVKKRVSATENIKVLQIHQLLQRHLYKQITS